MKIGLIGGTGLEQLRDDKFIEIKSDNYLKTFLYQNKHKIHFIPRHGFNHEIYPHVIDYERNINRLSIEGCQCILSTTACGSLSEDYKPGDFVILKQFIDFTKTVRHINRQEVIHTPMSDPYDKMINKIIFDKNDCVKYFGGNIITIEGPRFSTRLESNLFKNWGVNLINMTSAPEVIMANEFKIPYSSIAVVTDYDCWDENREQVNEQIVFENFKNNLPNLLRVVKNSLNGIIENQELFN